MTTSDRDILSVVALNRALTGKAPSGTRRYSVLTTKGDSYEVFALDRSHAMSRVREYAKRIEQAPYSPSVVSCRLVKD